MDSELKKIRKIHQGYGFDELSIIPGEKTVNSLEVDTHFNIPHPNGTSKSLEIPFLSSAMDSISSVRFCSEMGRLGGLATLNLEGLQTRYENPAKIYQEIAECDDCAITKLLQSVYTEPIKDDLVLKRISELNEAGVLVAVSTSAAKVEYFFDLIRDRPVDLLLIQDYIFSSNHHSTQYEFFNLKQLCNKAPFPIFAGNVATYESTITLLQSGVSGVVVGIGPGATCTSRNVLGIGVPQATATMECARARDHFYEQSGKYIPIITDGGIRNGGDVCKALVCGADAVMMGACYSRTKEAPGKGFHWGMTSAHAHLPRGARIWTGVSGNLKTILYGPACVHDGTQNLVGSLSTSMGFLGAMDIKALHEVEIVISSRANTDGFQSVSDHH